MTPEQKKAAEHAEILLAWSRGEKIELRDNYGKNTPWDVRNSDTAGFNFQTCEYRIAPKPAETWVFVYANGNIGGTTWNTKDGAERHHLKNGCAGRVVLMREVTE